VRLAIKLLLKIVDTPAMKEVGAELYAHPLPGCEKHSRYSDEYWECHTRHFTYLHWHDTSTCRMGPEADPTSVVDARLR
jgi:choline dehydrogenase-like flavoprotein